MYSLWLASPQQAALLQSVQRSRRLPLDAERACQTNSRSYPFIISERCARHGLHFAKRCASGRAVQAGQVRADLASATADTSLATACQSQATVHAGQHPLRHRATGELSLASRSAAGLRVRMRPSLRPCNPPRCTARANPCLGHPGGAPPKTSESAD